MKNQVMIKNTTEFSMTDIYEYLAGFTTKLHNKIWVATEKGQYYDVLVISIL